MENLKKIVYTRIRLENQETSKFDISVIDFLSFFGRQEVYKKFEHQDDNGSTSMVRCTLVENTTVCWSLDTTKVTQPDHPKTKEWWSQSVEFPMRTPMANAFKRKKNWKEKIRGIL